MEEYPDIVYTLPPNTSFVYNQSIFPDCDITCLSHYSWFSFSSNGTENYYGRAFPLSFVNGNQVLDYTLKRSSSPVWFTGFTNLTFGNNWTSPDSSYVYTFTLTNTPPGYVEPEDCPVCEECQECPVVPDNPYDDKLDNITQAIYTCGAILLVIYFFYCIYRMLIKNSGGK